MSKDIWITKCIHIDAMDHKHYEDVKVHIIIPFIDKLKQDEGVKKWYWSTKGDNLDWETMFPDIRICMLVEEGDEDRINRRFRQLIETNYGLCFHSDESSRSPAVLSKDIIESTIKGSEDAFRLLKKYPYKHIRTSNNEYSFAYFGALLRAIENSDIQRFHFIVNNISSGDDMYVLWWVGKMCSFYKRKVDRWQGKRKIRDRLLYYMWWVKDKCVGEL